MCVCVCVYESEESGGGGGVDKCKCKRKCVFSHPGGKVKKGSQVESRRGLFKPPSSVTTVL